MTTILDLGGAPANEPCAQLGQTPDFATLNALEVEVYRAALQARHGAAPDGCRFVPIDNHHDFGRYQTLGLAVDDADDPAVGTYAEAVEEGSRQLDRGRLHAADQLSWRGRSCAAS